MSRSYDWSPLHRSADPVSGDPSVVRDFARQYAEVAAAIGHASTRLTTIADDDNGESEFLDAFRAEAAEVAGRILKAKKRYSGVSKAVGEYATPLEDAQSNSVYALERARRGRDTSHDAQIRVNHYSNELRRSDLTEEERERYLSHYHSAEREVHEGQREVTAAEIDLQVAIDQRRSAAAIAVSAIELVENSGGINDSGWDNWVQFWEENGDWIDNVVTVIGLIGAAIAIVALFIPGVNLVVLAVIAIVVASIAIINAVCQASAGTKSIGLAIMEVGLALLPFGVGKIGSAVAKATLKTATTAAVKTTMSSMAGQGIKGWTVLRSTIAIEDRLLSAVPTVTQKLLSTNAVQLARIQMLGDMALTVGGESTRVAGIVNSSLWKFSTLPAVQTVGGVFGSLNLAGLAEGMGLTQTIEQSTQW